jgi:hypothetical protein
MHGVRVTLVVTERCRILSDMALFNRICADFNRNGVITAPPRSN